MTSCNITQGTNQHILVQNAMLDFYA